MVQYTKEKLLSMSVHTLRVILRTEFNGVPGVCNKNELIEQILGIQAGGDAPLRSSKGRKPLGEFIMPVDSMITLSEETNEAKRIKGIFELNAEGYGFVREKGEDCSFTDYFVQRQFVLKYDLKTGDLVEGDAHFSGECGTNKLKTVYFVNGIDCESLCERASFGSLKAKYPNRKLALNCKNSSILHALDEFCPIGRGQRCIIEDSLGKFSTDFAKSLVSAIDEKDVQVIFLSVGAKPEALESFSVGENCQLVNVPPCTDEESLLRIVNLIVERAKTLTLLGKEVVLIIDDLSYIASTYEVFLTTANTSKGFVKSNLTKNGYVREIFSIGGCYGENKSLTVIATFKSYRDEKLFEELVSIATSVVKLEGNDLLARRGYVIDLLNSYTEKDELLVSAEQISRTDDERKKLARDINYAREIFCKLP